MHGKFLKTLSQKPEYVKIHCIYRNNPFQFAIRKRFSNNNPQY